MVSFKSEMELKGEVFPATTALQGLRFQGDPAKQGTLNPYQFRGEVT
jgi:hypothetical protein